MARWSNANDTTICHGRNRSRKTMVTFQWNSIPTPPQFFPRLKRKATEHIGKERLIVIEHIHAPLINNRCRMAFTRVETPKLRIIAGSLDGLRSFDDIVSLSTSEFTPNAVHAFGCCCVVFHKELTHLHFVGFASQSRWAIVGARQRFLQIAMWHIEMPTHEHCHIECNREHGNDGECALIHFSVNKLPQIISNSSFYSPRPSERGWG